MKPTGRPLVIIPTSDLSPFSPKKSELQYFLERTAGSTLTTLGESQAAVSAHREVFPMGYTNIWVHRRVALFTAHGRRIDYPDPDLRAAFASDRVGRYFILYEEHADVDWVPVVYPRGATRQVLGFETATDAIAYAQQTPELSGATLITRLVEDIYWH